MKKGRQFAEINGKQWKDCGDRTLKRVQRAGAPKPRDADVETPHPTKPGFKVYWIFLALSFSCTLVYILGR